MIRKKIVCILLAASLFTADAFIINSPMSTVEAASGTQATVFNDMTAEEIAAKVGKLCQEDMQESGILASVSAAQFILESGYGKSELAQGANNCFGMKCTLSGNTWSGSTWDGKSKYTIQTREEYTVGNVTTITADFRKYSSVEESVADHSAYLLGAMNGSEKRYAGLAGEKDYKTAVQIIKDGGYATSSSYVTNVCNVIEKYDLTQYDKVTTTKKAASSEGTSKTSSKTTAKKTSKKTDSDMKDGDCPFLVRVERKDLDIREGAGTDYDATGENTGVGNFTIVKVKSGKGSSAGWGKLKSGAGWISLDFVKKVKE